MTPGKMAAQAGHAYTNSLLTYLESNTNRYEQPGQIGTKICLKAKHVWHLLKIKEQLEETNIPYSLITDSGHVMLPEFDGSPIVTALGIGPVEPEKIKHITKKLRLVE